MLESCNFRLAVVGELVFRAPTGFQSLAKTSWAGRWFASDQTSLIEPRPRPAPPSSGDSSPLSHATTQEGRATLRSALDPRRNPGFPLRNPRAPQGSGQEKSRIPRDHRNRAPLASSGAEGCFAPRLRCSGNTGTQTCATVVRTRGPAQPRHPRPAPFRSAKPGRSRAQTRVCGIHSQPCSNGLAASGSRPAASSDIHCPSGIPPDAPCAARARPCSDAHCAFDFAAARAHASGDDAASSTGRRSSDAAATRTASGPHRQCTVLRVWPCIRAWRNPPTTPAAASDRASSAGRCAPARSGGPTARPPAGTRSCSRSGTSTGTRSRAWAFPTSATPSPFRWRPRSRPRASTTLGQGAARQSGQGIQSRPRTKG